MKIKVCGMRDPENIRQVEKVGADMMGFIFYKGSSRFVNDMDPVITNYVSRVGVFVNETAPRIGEIVTRWNLDIIQLHGEETPEDCDVLSDHKLKVVKAFSIGENFDFNLLEPYIGKVDYFLFDTKGRNYGGNGVVFDWKILEEYQYDVPFWLSGGIAPGMAKAISALKFPMLYAVDVNSGFEEKPGYKNIEKLKHFIDELQD